jgi:hypothetical protein
MRQAMPAPSLWSENFSKAKLQANAHSAYMLTIWQWSEEHPKPNTNQVPDTHYAQNGTSFK